MVNDSLCMNSQHVSSLFHNPCGMSRLSRTFTDFQYVSRRWFRNGLIHGYLLIGARILLYLNTFAFYLQHKAIILVLMGKEIL